VKFICPEKNKPEDHLYDVETPLSLKAGCYKKPPSDFVNQMRRAAEEDEFEAGWVLTEPCSGMDRHVTGGDRTPRVPIHTDWCSPSKFKCEMPKAPGYSNLLVYSYLQVYYDSGIDFNLIKYIL